MDGYRDDAAEDPEDDELGYPYHRRAAASLLARPDKPVSARTNRARPVELPVEETSPPSSTSSDKPPAAQQPGRADETEPNRTGSMLLQLIACGSAAGSAKCRAEPRRSCGLVSRLASSAGADEEEAGGELSRRFGHLAVEEKEYFSGSIVESSGRATPLPSSLKRSNSYNEERSLRLGVGAIGEERTDEQVEGEEGIRGRCIPGRKRQQQQK